MFQASGGSVPLALGMASLTAAAVLAWLPQWRFRTALTGSPPPGERAAAEGVQAPAGVAGHGLHGPAEPDLLRNALLAPDAVPGQGADAARGHLLALMNLGNGITAMLLPMLAHRTRDQRWLAALTAIAAAIGLGGRCVRAAGRAAGVVLLLGPAREAGPLPSTTPWPGHPTR